eukprot:g621.t1
MTIVKPAFKGRSFSSLLRRSFSSIFLAQPHETSHEILALRDTTRRFVNDEVLPNIDKWEEDACGVPRSVFKKAGELGLLQVGYPEPFGIGHGNLRMMLALNEELCAAGSGGFTACLGSHAISTPVVVALGNEEQKRKYINPVMVGEKISALAITEASGGSDVANLRTTAKYNPSNDEYVVNGDKLFITSGINADFFIVAVRTGTKEEGAHGISLIVIDRSETDKQPGAFVQTPLRKMGWHCSDTASLHFQDLRIPAKNLLGKENFGFDFIMKNFNNERVMLASQAIAFAQVALDEATQWAQERKTFGKTLISHQTIRHKLIDMHTEVSCSRAMLYSIADRMSSILQSNNSDGKLPETLVAEICLLKNKSAAVMEFVSSEAIQILGGSGYLRGMKSERIFRETKVMQIGGGSTEIMKDLAAKQLRL